MRIQHNIPAMSAYRNYTNNVSAMKKNLEKLSSGYKINRAGDDAAGLAISEKMRAQITGLQTAQKNAKDGISLVQTAEGALTEVHDMLNRMVTLAEQSANGTYDDKTDRAQLQKELDQLRSEINRIADSSNFNGIKLLDGSMATDSIKTALAADPSGMVDGSTPTAATKANITVKVNSPVTSGTVSLTGVKDGQPAGAATPTEIKFSNLKGSTVKPDLAAANTQVDGAALAMTTKNTGASFKVTLGTGNTAAGVVKLQVAGATITTASLAASQNASTVAAAIVAAASTITVGSGSTAIKFNVTASGADLTFTAVSTKAFIYSTTAAKSILTSGAKVEMTNTVLATGGGNVASVAITATKGITLTSVKLNRTYDLSGWGSSGDKIKIGSVSVATAAASTPEKLAEELAKKGIKMNAENGYGAVTFTQLPSIAGKAGQDPFVLTADKTVEELLNADFGTSGKKVGDLFEVRLAGSSTAAPGTATLGNAEVKLVAKVGGKLSASAETVVNALSNQGAEVTLGADQGQASGGGKTTYKFEFDTSKLEGGQYLYLGTKAILFTTGSTSSIPTKANTPTIASSAITKIDLTGKDAADIADAIQTALGSKVFASGFNVGNAVAVSTNANNTKFTISVVATAAASSANLGEVRFSMGSVGSKAMKATYTAFNPNNSGSIGKFASAEWTVSKEDLKAGTTLTIGSKSIKIVKSNADAAKNEIAVESTGYASNAKIIAAFEKAGFKGGKIAIATAGTGAMKVTITEADYTGKSGAEFAAKEGMLTVAKETTKPVKVEGGLVEITTGTTQYKNIMSAAVTGSAAVKDLFNVTVNGKLISADDTTTIKAGDEIKFEAKSAGALTQEVLDKFKYTSGAVVNRLNGSDEGSGAAGANTHYGLTFNLTQISGGQTFAIGNGSGSKTFEITFDAESAGNGVTGSDEKINGDHIMINLAGMDPTTLEGQQKMQKEIQAKVQTAMGTDFDVSNNGDPLGGVFTLNLDAKKAGTDSNLGEIRISQANSAISGVYDPATSGETGTKGKFAQVTYDLDLSKLEAGDVLTIGGTSINIVADGEKTVGNQITLSDAKNADKLAKAFGGNQYPADQLKFENGKLTITGTAVGQTGADLAANSGKVTLTSVTRDLSAKTGGLTLQIGDTAESFNQLKVDIKDCHTAGLGIADISIADQDSAAKAIDAIKSAINYVSDVRGTLGATQNRLDHTINNLSVMTENIQDAESTIRDVDIAEEMMAYTKNNILIQSAQAMLAQANQMPQGVLQLLQ